MKATKTVRVWFVQGNYGTGWDDLCADVSRRGALQDLRDYRNNEPNPHRLISRRVKRENFESGNY